MVFMINHTEILFFALIYAHCKFFKCYVPLCGAVTFAKNIFIFPGFNQLYGNLNYYFINYITVVIFLKCEHYGWYM